MSDFLPRHRSFAVLSIACGTILVVTTEFLPIGLLTPMRESLGTSVGMRGLAVVAAAIVGWVAHKAPGSSRVAQV